jgi:hypothetical protein
MSDEKKTCEDRIKDQFESRLESITPLSEREPEYDEDGNEIERDEDEEDDDSELLKGEDVLDVEKKRSIRILLSTGGPGDWFEVDVDSDNSLGDVTYHFQDWFDHAEMRVYGDAADAVRAWIEREGLNPFEYE